MQQELIEEDSNAWKLTHVGLAPALSAAGSPRTKECISL